MIIPPTLSPIERDKRSKYVRYAKACGMKDARLGKVINAGKFAHESLLYYAYINAWRDASRLGWLGYVWRESQL